MADDTVLGSDRATQNVAASETLGGSSFSTQSVETLASWFRVPPALPNDGGLSSSNRDRVLELSAERLDNPRMTAYRENARDSLADLDAGENRVLAELVRLLVRSDDKLSGAEREQIARIADEVGDDDFWKMMDEAASSGAEPEAVLKAAESIGAKDAQELIYGALFDLSIQDGIDPGENDVLDRLQAMWELQIENVPPEPVPRGG